MSEDRGATIDVDLRHESAKLVIDRVGLNPRHVVDDVRFEVTSGQPFALLSLSIYVAEATVVANDGAVMKFHTGTVRIIRDGVEVTT